MTTHSLSCVRAQLAALLARDEREAHAGYIASQKAAQAALQAGDRTAYEQRERESAWRHDAWRAARSRLVIWTEGPGERVN